MKKSLIIFTHGGGRFANQMTNHAHLIAFHEEYGEQYDIINLAFGPYSALFKHLNTSKIQHLPVAHPRWKYFTSAMNPFVISREDTKKTLFNQILRLVHGTACMLPFSQSIKYGTTPNFLAFLPGTTVPSFDLDAPGTHALLRRKPVTALAGWPIRSWRLFEKHQERIRTMFEIQDEYQRKGKEFIDRLRVRYDLLIGVLIRQGDYRTWADGKYFFSDEDYLEWMKEAQSIFPQKKVAFVIASDEFQEEESFSAVPAFFSTGTKHGSSHFVESFVALSLCDFVMTPPSTFGVWAAFLGNIPVIPLCEKNRSIASAEFLNHNLFDALKHPHMSVSVK